jgi:3-oxoacyl-[acyl-carrier-protein] synthase II
MERKVVITGMGAVTPLGNSVGTFWDGLINGRSGIARIASFDASDLASQIAGEVKNFDGTIYFRNSKEARRTDRYTQFAVAAAKEAFSHAHLREDVFNASRGGVIIGSSIGGLITLSEQFQIIHKKGAHRLSPFVIPMLLNNMAAGIVSIELGLQGPSYSVGAACATANQSIGEAWRSIRTGEADIILAGGSEAAICEMSVGGFSAMKALSTRNDAPEEASRPFDRGRDGFIIAEGAGVLVLEEETHARRRGVPILAELAGNGVTSDAYHMTHPLPDGQGAARAMRFALDHARLNPEEVSYINAHATSTPVGDQCESQAIRAIFGDQPVPVTANKSMTGHLCGATGAIELIACVKSIEQNLIPPTINLTDPDPECALHHVVNVAREAKIDAVLSNSFGFGGHNSSLVVKRHLN